MRRYLLVGNYGVGNVGDEALKEYFLARFPEVEWIVVSAKPALGLSSNSTVEVPRLPLGFRSLCTPWWQTVRAYWQCDGVVFGGGSLFTDAESVWAPFLWFGHAALAVFFRRPLFLAFQGIGPFRTRGGEWLARWVLWRAVFLSVRDTLSLARVERWKLYKKCILSFDPVFSRIGNGIQLCSSFSAMPDDSGRSKFLLIIPRGNPSKEFHRRMAEVQKECMNPLSPAPLLVRTCPTCRSFGRADVHPGGPLRQERGVSSVRVVEPASFRELCEAVSSASFLLTQRYHAGIAALALGVPFETVPQVPGDKLDALNLEDRDRARLEDRVRVGGEELRKALQASFPHGRGSR